MRHGIAFVLRTACILTSCLDWSVHAQTPSPAPVRTVIDFNADWRFIKGDTADAMMPRCDDSSWRRLNLPHDWSIEGPFGPQYGSGNGYAPGGVAWYRKHFTVDKAHQGRLAWIEFDGVYDHSQVYLNGFVVGDRAYGYSSFRCDSTPYLKFGSEDNVIAVRVDHSRFADSRWYTGSGIYRNVRLCITDKLHIGPDGVYVTTPDIQAASANVRIETTVRNASGETRPFSLESEIVGPAGQSVGSALTKGSLENNSSQAIVQQIVISRPQLWSIDSPVLYVVKTRLSAERAVVDETATSFGVRTIRFDPNNGFSLNGKRVKLKGVCIHHDAGCLGAAVPEKVLERRLRSLRELGVNSIRTSHNPPAPELLDLCDRLGLLVKDEAFDEFTPAKNKWVAGWNAGQPSRWGYADDFVRWAVTDIEDMVRRDRNHPSVIIWSIGNEVDYANDPFSHPVLGERYRPHHPPAEELTRLGKPLVDAVKRLDPTRPVSAALANIVMSNAVGLPEILDIVGYNYQEGSYPAEHVKYPQRVIFGSENNHRYENWRAVRDNDYVAGQYLWTGIDYLGEARAWPSLGSGAGLLDTCGFKKPNAWFRQSLWSDEPMVYLCTSVPGASRANPREETWNRPADSTVLITCYTNCEQVDVTLNGKSIGSKRLAEAVDGAMTWTIGYEPGVLKAVGMKNGVAVSQYVLKTAGPASRIELIPDVTGLRADGKDISHVEFRVTDAQNVRVPDAQNELSFELSGPAQVLGIDNGSLTGPRDYKAPLQKAWRGRGLVVLQSTTAPGKIELRVTSPGLQPAAVELWSR